MVEAVDIVDRYDPDAATKLVDEIFRYSEVLLYDWRGRQSAKY